MVYGGETQQVWLDVGLLTHVELRGATQHHLPQFSNFCWRPFPVVCVAFLTHISQQKHNITQLYQGYQASLSRVYAKIQDPEPQRCCLSFWCWKSNVCLYTQE